MRKLRIVAALLTVLAFSISGIGQKLTLDLYTFPTVETGFSPALIAPYSGVSISVDHGRNQLFQTSLAFRSMPWGSELALSERFVYVKIERDKYFIGNTSNVFLGFPLFYNKFSVSTALSSEFNIALKKYPRFYFSAGMRYNLYPSYRKISENYRFLEGLIGMHFVLKK